MSQTASGQRVALVAGATRGAGRAIAVDGARRDAEPPLLPPRQRAAPRAPERTPQEPGSPEEKILIERLTAAYQDGDVAAIVALFTDDAWLRMPPRPLEYQGRDLIGTFLRVIAFRDGRTYRLEQTRANGQLAFATYLPGAAAPNDLLVLTLDNSKRRIRAMTRFPPQTSV